MVFLPLVALLLSACSVLGEFAEDISQTLSFTKSFTISLNPSTLTVTQTISGKTTLTITPKRDFSGLVELSLVNPPAGVSLSPYVLPVWFGLTQEKLTISTTWDTPPGKYTLTLKAKATSSSIESTATLTLNVNQPSIYNVDTTDDTIDARTGDGRCADENGRCSLRAAIMEANTRGTPVVINIPAGTYTLTRTSRVDEQGGDLDIGVNIALKGAGADKTILDGNGTDRVLEVYKGSITKVEGVTIRNGKANAGGGIYNEGTLTLEDSTVSGNSASNGGGILNSGTLTLRDSTVSGNSASNGGGILNLGTLTLRDSTVSGNSARYGGGVYNDGSDSTANLSFSTIARNQATSGGGGIQIGSGTVKLRGVILANNTSPTGPECSGSLTSKGYNLIRSNSDCAFTAQTTDITGQDPALGPLEDNDGPTQTHLPAAGSPVVDKVPSEDCTDLGGNRLATDQRGVSRPQGNYCDIGSVER
ncbi:MAG: choice-of-anchor Q domain-containing protein [Thermaceae bacterium]